jgi:hypothetical protein
MRYSVTYEHGDDSVAVVASVEGGNDEVTGLGRGLQVPRVPRFESNEHSVGQCEIAIQWRRNKI